MSTWNRGKDWRYRMVNPKLPQILDWDEKNDEMNPIRRGFFLVIELSGLVYILFSIRTRFGALRMSWGNVFTTTRTCVRVFIFELLCCNWVRYESGRWHLSNFDNEVRVEVMTWFKKIEALEHYVPTLRAHPDSFPSRSACVCHNRVCIRAFVFFFACYFLWYELFF